VGNEERRARCWCMDAVVVGARVCMHGEWYVGTSTLQSSSILDFTTSVAILCLLCSLLLPMHTRSCPCETLESMSAFSKSDLHDPARMLPRAAVRFSVILVVAKRGHAKAPSLCLMS